MPAKHIPCSELCAQLHHIASPPDGLSSSLVARTDGAINDDPGAFGLIPGGKERSCPLMKKTEISETQRQERFFVEPRAALLNPH